MKVLVNIHPKKRSALIFLAKKSMRNKCWGHWITCKWSTKYIPRHPNTSWDGIWTLFLVKGPFTVQILTVKALYQNRTSTVSYTNIYQSFSDSSSVKKPEAKNSSLCKSKKHEFFGGVHSIHSFSAHIKTTESTWNLPLRLLRRIFSSQVTAAMNWKWLHEIYENILGPNTKQPSNSRMFGLFP